VLKVRYQKNLDEMEAGIRAGHTVNGWQMPKGAEPGDFAVWYAASPDQEYRARGGWQQSPGASCVAVQSMLTTGMFASVCPSPSSPARARSRRLEPGSATGRPSHR